jgi:hypothetical protein
VAVCGNQIFNLKDFVVFPKKINNQKLINTLKNGIHRSLLDKPQTAFAAVHSFRSGPRGGQTQKYFPKPRIPLTPNLGLLNSSKDGNKQAGIELEFLNVSIRARIEDFDNYYGQHFQDFRTPFFEKQKFRLRRYISKFSQSIEK